jgi:hypothetical protein
MHLSLRSNRGMFKGRSVDWSRGDTMKVAQHFSAGLGFENRRSIPLGTKDGTDIPRITPPHRNTRNGSRNRCAIPECSIVPAGTGPAFIISYPAVKCWATFTVLLLSSQIVLSCEDSPLTSHQSLLTVQFWLRLCRAVSLRDKSARIAEYELFASRYGDAGPRTGSLYRHHLNV